MIKNPHNKKKLIKNPLSGTFERHAELASYAALEDYEYRRKDYISAKSESDKKTKDEVSTAKSGSTSSTNKPKVETKTGKKSDKAETKSVDNKSKDTKKKDEKGFFGKMWDKVFGSDDEPKQTKPTTTKKEEPVKKDTVKTNKVVLPSQVAPVKVDPVPAVVTNTKEQDLNVENTIAANTKQLEDTIKQLEDRKKELQNKPRTYPSFYSQSAMSYINQSNPYQEEINKVQKQIDQITKQKDDYATLMRLANKRSDLLEGVLTNLMIQSDAFVKQQTATAKANKIADEFDKKYHTGSYLWGIIDTYDSSYSKEFTKAVQKARDNNHKSAELARNYQKVQQWVNKRILDGYSIPTKLEDFPERLREYAKSAFTQNGKFAFEDEEFRNRLLEETRRSKKDIELSSDLIKDYAANPASLDDKQLNDRYNWIQIQKDEIRARNPQASTNRFYKGSEYNPYHLSSEDRNSLDNLNAQEQLLEKAMHYKRMHNLLMQDEGKKNTFGKIITEKKAKYNPLINIGASAVEFFSNGNTYLFDAYDIKEATLLYKASEKLINNKKLTDQDRDLLEAKMLEDAYKGQYGAYEDISSYKWGKIGAESLKFMAEFIATNGVANTLQGHAKVAGLLTKVALKNSSKFGAKVASKLLPAMYRLGADATYATMLTNTLGLPRTVLDALEEARGGNVSAHYNQFGGLEIDGIVNSKGEKVSEMPSMNDAFIRSEKRNFIENFSEMMGEWGIGKGLAWTGKKIGLNKTKVGKILKDIEDDIIKGGKNRAAKTAKEILENFEKNHSFFAAKTGIKKYIPTLQLVFNERTLKAGQFHGIFGEVSEEYYGVIMQHLMGVQDNPDMTGVSGTIKDMIDQSRDIWGGILVSTGMLGAVGMGTAIKHQIDFENSVSNLDKVFGEKQSYELQRQLAFANPNEITNVASRMLGPLLNNKEGKSKEKYEALDNYILNLLKNRGAAYSELVMESVGRSLYDQNKKAARDAGFRFGSYETTKLMDMVTDILQSDLDEFIADESGELKELIDMAINNDDYSELIDGIENGTIELSDKSKASQLVTKLLSLQNAHAYRDGSNLSISEGIEDQIKYQRRRLGKLINTDTHKGKIVIIGKRKKSEKEGEKDSFENDLILIRGNLRTGVDRKIYGLENDKKVLVANPSTYEYFYVSTKDLEGYEFETPDGISPGSQLDSNIKAIEDNQEKRRKEVFKTIREKIASGQPIKIGDKTVTIINTDAKGGVDYAVHDEDNSNPQFYHVDSMKQLLESLEKQEQDEANEIANTFRDHASMLVAQQLKNNKILADLDRQAAEKAAKEAAEKPATEPTTEGKSSEEATSSTESTKPSESTTESKPSSEKKTKKNKKKGVRKKISTYLKLRRRFKRFKKSILADIDDVQYELSRLNKREDLTEELKKGIRKIYIDVYNIEREINKLNVNIQDYKTLRKFVDSLHDEIVSKLQKLEDDIKNSPTIIQTEPVIEEEIPEVVESVKEIVETGEKAAEEEKNENKPKLFGSADMPAGVLTNVKKVEETDDNWSRYEFDPVIPSNLWIDKYIADDEEGDDVTKKDIYGKPIYAVEFDTDGTWVYFGELEGQYWWSLLKDGVTIEQATSNQLSTIPLKQTEEETTEEKPAERTVIPIVPVDDSPAPADTVDRNVETPGSSPAKPIIPEEPEVDEKVKEREAEKEAIKQQLADDFEKALTMFGGIKKLIEDDEEEAKLMTVLTRIGVNLAKLGIITIAEQSKQFVDKLGDQVRPYLKQAYSGARYSPRLPEEIRAQMDDDKAVSSFDPNNFDKSANTNKDLSEAVAKLTRIMTSANNSYKKRLNGFHYFITDESGRTYLHRRAHSIMISLKKENAETKKKEEEYALQLKDALAENVDTFEAVVNQLIDEIVEDYKTRGIYKNRTEEGKKQLLDQVRSNIKYGLQLNLYIDHLNKYQNKEDEKEVIEAVSHILAENFEQLPNPSVIIGSIFDEICRTYLGNDTYARLEEMEIYVYGKKQKLSDPITIYTKEGEKQIKLITDGAYDAILNELKHIKEYYKNLGWKLITDEYIVRGTIIKNGKKIRVAGATDCVAVDQNGNYHLIDFKTYSHRGDNKGKKYYDYSIGGGFFHSSDFFRIGDKDEDSFSAAVGYSQQAAIYTLLASLDGIQFVDRAVMLFGVNRQTELNISSLTEENFENGNSHLTIEKEGVKQPNIVYLDESQTDEGVKQMLETMKSEFKTQLEPLQVSTDDIEDYDLILKNNVLLQLVSEQWVQDQDVDDLRVVGIQLSDELLDIKTNHLKKVGPTYVINTDDLDELEKLNVIEILTKLLVLAKVGIIRQSDLDDAFNIVKNLGLLGEIENCLTKLNEEEVEIKYNEEPTVKDFTEVTGLINSAEGYDNVENSVNKKGKHLTEVTSNPDFITNSTFEIIFKPGTEDKELPSFQLKITYNGEEYSPIDINFAHPSGERHLTKEAKLFYNMLRADLKKTRIFLNPESIHRTNGRILNGENNTNVDVESLLGKSIYDIEYSARSNDFGLTKVVVRNGEAYVIVQAPGDTKTKRKRILYKYTNSKRNNTNPTGGVMVMMTHPQHNEKDEPVDYPVNIITATFSEQQSDFVSKILLGDFSKDDDTDKNDIESILNSHYWVNNIRTPLLVRDVLNMFISYGQHNYIGKEHVHIEVTGNVVKIVGKVQGLSELVHEFDFSDDEQVKQFKSFLSENVRLQITEQFLSSRLNDENFSQLFSCSRSDMFNFFKNTGMTEIPFGKTGSTLSKDDISDTTRDDVENKHKPISGLGWYIRNGHLLTSFEGFEKPLFSIDDNAKTESVVDKPEEPKKEKETEAPKRVILTNPSEQDEEDDDDDDDENEDNHGVKVGTRFSIRRGSNAARDISEEYSSELADSGDNALVEDEARKHIADILGEEFPVEIVDELLSTVGQLPIAGRIRLDAITLSRQGKRGVEYHEAFHRLLELSIPKKLREKAYKKYRRKFGQTLTEKEISEKAADEFWWYMDNKIEFKPSWDVIDMFKQLKAYYKFFSKIGSFTLYRLYKQAEAGKFKNVKPTEEHIERWKQFTELYSFSVVGMKDLHHISNSIEYDAVLDTIRSIIMDPRTYENDNYKLDPTGHNLDKLEISLEKIIYSPFFNNIISNPRYSDVAVQRLFEVLGLRVVEVEGENGEKEETFEIVNKNAIKAIESVMAGLRKFGVEGSTNWKKMHEKKVKVEKTVGDSESEGKDNLMQTEKGVFDKTSAEISSIEKASEAVKFFFSRIFKMEDRAYLDLDGNIVHEAVASKNAAGLPSYMNVHDIWNLITNHLHNCRTVYDLYTKLDQLQKQEIQYQPVFKAFDRLMRQTFKFENNSFFNKDGIPNQVLDENSYGQVIQIVSYISQAKVIPLVIQSLLETETDGLKGATKVLNANNDHVCKSIRGHWAELLVSGDIPAISTDEHGNMYVGSKLFRDPVSSASFFVALANIKEEDFKKSKLQLNLEIEQLQPDGSFKKVKIIRKLSSLNLNDANDINLLKLEFIRRLHKFGILIDLDDFNYLLNNLYKDSGPKGFIQFCEQQQTILAGFYSNVEKTMGYGRYGNAQDVNGRAVIIDKNKVAGLCKNDQLCQMLAAAMYKRLEETKEMLFLTIGGKRIYALSEHNYITDNLDLLAQDNSEQLQELMNDPYHASYEEGQGYTGSSVLIALDEDQADRTQKQHEFVFQSLYGLKTDVPGNEGVEFLDLSTLEDVIVKYGVLASGGLLFPTMSDKTTYGAVYDKSGLFKTLGLDWTAKADRAFYADPRNIAYSKEDYISTWGDGKLLINFNDTTLNYFINIFKCEYRSAKLELLRIQQGVKFGYGDRVESFHDGSSIEDKDFMADDYSDMELGYDENYETGKLSTKHIVHQGARLSTFTGILIDLNTATDEEKALADEDGFISFNKVKDKNGNYVNEEQCLEIADKYFFSKSSEEQKELVKRILSEQVQKELDYLQKNDMVYVDANGHYKNSDTCGLDTPKLKKMQTLLSGVPQGFYDEEDNDENAEKRSFIMEYEYQTEGDIHSKAIIAYAADMVVKQQQSMQEMFRIYAGNFSCFKWRYDEKGRLVDTTTDFFKRTGGYVSTGQHNVTSLADVNEEVVCAEAKDEMYTTSELYDIFKEGGVRLSIMNQYMDIYMKNFLHNGKIIRITIDNIKQFRKEIDEKEAELDALSNEDLIKEFKKLFTTVALNDILVNGADFTEDQKTEMLKQAKELAEAISKMVIGIAENKLSALEEINVNDGATFITDEFCERLLRSIGKWDNDIKLAFKILRNAGKQWTQSDDYSDMELGYSDLNNIDDGTLDNNRKYFSNKDVMSVAEAYNKVLTTMMGSQKYTAYGRHSNEITVTDENGQEVTYTRLTTYYDKTSFIPVFSCMASGHMKAILEKMHRQGIDVLKMSSAIKEGGKGAVNLNEDVFSQWDSDPTTFDSFGFNTYSQRLSDMRKQFNTDPKEGEELMSLGTQYVKVVLSLLKAHQMYDVNGEKMDAQDIRTAIMDAFKGVYAAQGRKFDEKYFKNGELDIKAFMGMLQKQLADRDPNDPLVKALGTEEVDGKTKLRLPVSALASTTWIESIVTSVVNKELININTPGSAFYQRPDFAMEGKMPTNYVNQDDFDYEINHGAKLKQVNEEGSIDCVLSIDYFNYIFDEFPNLKNQSFAEKKAWLVRHGIISGWDLKLRHEGKRVVLEDVISTFTVKEGDVYKDKDGNVITVTKEDAGTEVTGVRWKHATANIVGYRIPTQAVSSIQAMRCVDVIPIVCHTVILPKEITAVTGSDFDIDKFFLSTLYYKAVLNGEDNQAKGEALKQDIDAKKEEIKQLKKNLKEAKKTKDPEAIEKAKTALEAAKQELDFLYERENELWDEAGYHMSTDSYDEESTEAQCNKLLKLQIGLLKTVKKNIAELQGSIDSDTKPLKTIANKIRNKNKKPALHSLDSTSLRVNVDAKISFAIGKSGIGPYALNNNNHVFTMIYGVKFVHNDKSILSLLDLEDLSGITDQHGRSILSWLSGLINAHVDVAKDPFIRALGVNKYTYNLVSLLIRTGYGEETFWFTTQPIMQQLYNAFDLASGVYNQPVGTTVSSRTNNAVHEIYYNLVNDIIKPDKPCGSEKRAKDLIDSHIKKRYGKTSFDLIKQLMKTKKGVSVMESISTAPDGTIKESYDIGLTKDGSVVEVKYEDLQLLTLLANFELQTHAQNLSKLVQFTKIDTKKQGKTIIEQQAYLHGYKELDSPEKSPFEREGIHRMLHDSFINEKTIKTIQKEKELLSGQLILATDGYDKLLRRISDLLNADRSDLNFATSVYNMILAKIKADFFFFGSNSYCALRDIDPFTLLTSSNVSIYSRLKKIQAEIADLDNHKYDYLRNETGKCNNYLINNLICGSTYNTEEISKLPESQRDKYESAKFIVRLNDVTERTNEADMKNAWNDLLNDNEHPELQRFAEELIVYAFITSAGIATSTNLFRYVPEQWMIGETDVTKLTDYEKLGGLTFGRYIEQKIEQFNEDEGSYVDMYTDEELNTLITNFAYDHNIVPEMKQSTVSNYPQFTNNADYPIFFAPVYGFNSDTPSTLYTDGKWPGYVKIRNNDEAIRTGQNFYRVYKVVGTGRIKVNDKYIEYPIYGLVPASGGSYGRNKIFEIGYTDELHTDYTRPLIYMYGSLQNTSDFDGKRLYDYVTEHVSNPSRFFNQLLHLSTVSDASNIELHRTLEGLEKYDNTAYPPGYDILTMFVDDVVYNERAKLEEGEFLAESAQDIYERYATLMQERGVEMNEGTLIKNTTINTDLHVEQIDDRYSPVDEDKFFEETGINKELFKAQAAKNNSAKTFHIEYYKKLTTIDGKSAHNYVATISFRNKKHLGFFEMVADIDKTEDGHFKPNGDFSVHFKTFMPLKSGTKFAQVAMNPRQKAIMFRWLISLIPNEARVSTWGTLSKGGLNAILHLDSWAVSSESGVLKDTGETREVEMKDTGEKVNIPIWQKVGGNIEDLYAGGITHSPNPSGTGAMGTVPKTGEEIINQLDKDSDDMKCDWEKFF